MKYKDIDATEHPIVQPPLNFPQILGDKKCPHSLMAVFLYRIGYFLFEVMDLCSLSPSLLSVMYSSVYQWGALCGVIRCCSCDMSHGTRAQRLSGAPKTNTIKLPVL